jgi:2,5-diketo-D-gluconate reductase A
MTFPKTLAFNDGHHIPQLGLGVWQLPADDTARIVAEAIGIGYRLIDGAAIYGNEAGMGRGIAESGVPREEVFATSKIWNDAQGYDATQRALDGSLKRLGLARLDLCLIHWPCPDAGTYVDTWRALIAARDAGKVTSIGVSNFNPDHLDRIIGETGVTPALNQIELHPYLQQDELRARHAELGIVTQSWSPLGHSTAFDDPVITGLASTHGLTVAQVILAWHLALGLSVIPRSSNAARLAQNFDLEDVSLSADDMAAIAALDRGQRMGPDPLKFS